MLSQTLIFTTLFATLAPLVSAGDAADFTINAVKGAVQCKTTTLSWKATPDAKDLTDCFIFTACEDERDTPIATYNKIPAGADSIQFYVNQPTGSGMFAHCVDVDGNDYYSDDFYAGGSQGDDEDACKAHIKTAGLTTIVKDLSAATAAVGATASDPTDSTDTTQSTDDGTLDPIANAANTDGTTTTVDKITAGGALGTKANAAGKMTVSPSTSVILGLAGAGLLAFF